MRLLRRLPIVLSLLATVWLTAQPFTPPARPDRDLGFTSGRRGAVVRLNRRDRLDAPTGLTGQPVIGHLPSVLPDAARTFAGLSTGRPAAALRSAPAGLASPRAPPAA